MKEDIKYPAHEKLNNPTLKDSILDYPTIFNERTFAGNIIDEFNQLLAENKALLELVKDGVFAQKAFTNLLNKKEKEYLREKYTPFHDKFDAVLILVEFGNKTNSILTAAEDKQHG